MKKISFLFIAAIFVLLFSTCFSPYAGDEATITLNLGGGQGRAVTKDGILNSLSYTIRVGSKSFGPFVGQTDITVSVIPGRWAIEVEGYQNGVLFAEGYTTEYIRPGHNPISINMEPAIIKEVSAVEKVMAVWQGTVHNPIKLRFDLELGADEWEGILDTIGGTTPLKYVTMDLSRCKPGNGYSPTGYAQRFGLYVDLGPGTIIFDPEPNQPYALPFYQSGKAQVLSIILPDVAEVVQTISIDTVFAGFTALVRAEGRNVTIIGDKAFSMITTLTSVDFPKASTIGESAFTATGLTSVSFPEATHIGDNVFSVCNSLTSVYLPKVTSLGNTNFISSTAPLVITFGSAAPTVGTNTFQYIAASKTVTIRVPRGATGYITGSLPVTAKITVTGGDSSPNWGNGFRGAGWNGSALGSGTINQSISLTIVPY